ncbi:hypothetical protein K440DRAFT_639745 [Wilcoxina mikolae CBS 423.85]|nr:hypothetical protein K440DRAFT_639745 [Wilcoxina mikolae CBS 423.85]
MYTPTSLLFTAAAVASILSITNAIPLLQRQIYNTTTFTPIPKNTSTYPSFCAGRPYMKDTYTCWFDHLLCPTGKMPCGSDAQKYACYRPTEHRCVNEALVPVPKGVFYQNVYPNVYPTGATTGATTGRVAMPTGRVAMPTGRVAMPTGRVVIPTGRVAMPTGTGTAY